MRSRVSGYLKWFASAMTVLMMISLFLPVSLAAGDDRTPEEKWKGEPAASSLNYQMTSEQEEQILNTCKGMTPEDIRNFIMDNQDDYSQAQLQAFVALLLKNDFPVPGDVALVVLLRSKPENQKVSAEDVLSMDERETAYYLDWLSSLSQTNYNLAMDLTLEGQTKEDQDAMVMWFQENASGANFTTWDSIGIIPTPIDLETNSEATSEELSDPQAEWQAAGEAEMSETDWEIIRLMGLAEANYSGDDMTGQSYESAAEYYKQAADLGSVKAQYMYGLMLKEGMGVKIDPEGGAAMIEKAAENGNTDAMLELAQLYKKGDGVDGDYDKWAYWTKKAADEGNTEGEYRYGEMLFYGTAVEQDRDAALLYIQKAADGGSPEAQINLGMKYEYGEGVEKNTEKAFQLYKAASDHGDANGNYYLANMYLEGKGTEKNVEKAIALLKGSAEKGNTSAMYQLGLMYEKGDGVEKNPAEGTAWMEKAAQLGNEDAQDHLAGYDKMGEEIAAQSSDNNPGLETATIAEESVNKEETKPFSQMTEEEKGAYLKELNEMSGEALYNLICEISETVSDEELQEYWTWFAENKIFEKACPSGEQSGSSGFSVPKSCEWPANVPTPDNGKLRMTSKGGDTFQAQVAGITQDDYQAWKATFDSDGTWKQDDEIGKKQIEKAISSDFGPMGQTAEEFFAEQGNEMTDDTYYIRSEGTGSAMLAFGGDSALVVVSQGKAKSSSDVIYSMEMSDAEKKALLDQLADMGNEDFQKALDANRNSLSINEYSELMNALVDDERFAEVIQP